jgi:hypothetical protein
MAVWGQGINDVLGGFTGATQPAGGMGGAMAQGGMGGGGMDMQGFLGMLMQFLRHYQGGGGSMQSGQFPLPTGQMPQQMPQQMSQQMPQQTGTQVYTPQNPSDWQQYSRPPRQAPQRSQFPMSGPEAGGALGNVFTTDMFGERQPYTAPPTEGGMGHTLSR